MLIVANWKAYVEDLTKAKELLVVAKRLAKTTKHTIVLAPPAPLFGALAIPNKSSVAFSAQDISITTGGAETGESTAQVYATVGATYAIIGHSERRAKGETNDSTATKLAHALAHGLTPILCVGEQERDEEGRYLSFIRTEISTALEELTPKERGKIIIAYEPIWAIGKTASEAIHPSDLAEMVLYIRKILTELLPGKNATRTQVLYGGSVEAKGAYELEIDSGINGFLVGHASVDPLLFSALVKKIM